MGNANEQGKENINGSCTKQYISENKKSNKIKINERSQNACKKLKNNVHKDPG